MYIYFKHACSKQMISMGKKFYILRRYKKAVLRKTHTNKKLMKAFIKVYLFKSNLTYDPNLNIFRMFVRFYLFNFISVLFSLLFYFLL